MAKGNISVDSENLFPIIKKWLYSDKDIFLRELVSNACDAITKHKTVVLSGEAEAMDDYKITVTVDKPNKKLIISDNGIGMSAQEIDKYINQIAFSGASEFLEKYKKEDDEGSQIIGHFGLGFYSAFMVADTVEISSLSYREGEKSAKWLCDGSMEFDMTEGDRKTRGTDIILNVAEDSLDFLEESQIRQILRKYCAFLPVPIYLENTETVAEEPKEGEDEKAHAPINTTTPLWMKKPSECTEEEYKEFYRQVFMDFNEPLFWIHLNVDYPFNLKGILYFPKINHEFSGLEGEIKLFNNQVFVADNVKEVIPEFLMLLKGVIDCPELPLNVSRSFLQNDGYVNKISSHITRKIADKLVSLYTNDKENYVKFWEDINIFVKYGCLRDEKFYEKVKESIVYKNLDGEYKTLTELMGEKESVEIFYVSDELQQSQYINMFKNEGLCAVILPAVMDTHFISFIEMKNPNVKFKRIDSSLSDIAEDEGEGDDSIIEIFKAEINDEALKIEVKKLRDPSIPAVILLSEETRRMKEMYRSYSQQFAGMADMFRDEFTLVVNSENELVKKLGALDSDTRKLVVDHVYDLARISHKPLTAEEMSEFIKRSNEILKKMI